jgi:hypothetical protein
MILARAVLAAAIRVMEQTLSRSPPGNSSKQCLHQQILRHALAQSVANELAVD